MWSEVELIIFFFWSIKLRSFGNVEIGPNTILSLYLGDTTAPKKNNQAHKVHKLARSVSDS